MIITPLLSVPYQTTTGKTKYRITYRNDQGIELSHDSWDDFSVVLNQPVEVSIRSRNFKGRQYEDLVKVSVLSTTTTSVPVTPPMQPVATPKLDSFNKLSARQTALNAAANLYQGTGKQPEMAKAAWKLYKLLLKEDWTDEDIEIFNFE